jgi:hypothetical protein
MTKALRLKAKEYGSTRPLARQAGIQHASLMRFVRGDSSLRLDKADALAAVLGVEVVLVGEVPKKPKKRGK